MKQQTAIAIALLLVLFCTGLKAQKATDILGFWISEKEDLIIEVGEDDQIFFAKIVWLADSTDAFGAPLRDVVNNETQLRSRLVKGVRMLYGFEYHNGHWRNGRIYNYRNGNSYNGNIHLKEDRLKLTGFYGLLWFLGKTHNFYRLAAPYPPVATP